MCSAELILDLSKAIRMFAFLAVPQSPILYSISSQIFKRGCHKRVDIVVTLLEQCIRIVSLEQWTRLGAQFGG